MPKRFNDFLFSLTAVLLTACYPNTKITGSWKDPAANQKYGNIFVTALSSNAVSRATVEGELATALAKKGLTAIKSMDAFPPAFTGRSITKDELMQVVREKTADAILTFSLLKK